MRMRQHISFFIVLLALIVPFELSAQSGATLIADFNPTEARIPNAINVLFTGSRDGTLNIPVAPDDPRAPVIEALNSLDGFSTVNPIVATFSNGVVPDTELPLSDSAIDPASVIPGQSVRLFEVEAVNPFLEPNTTRPFAIKKVERELAPNVDYIATVTGESGKTLAIVPVRPLRPKTNYLVVLTDDIRVQADGSRAVPDTTYIFTRYRGNHQRPLVDDNGSSNFPNLTDEQAQSLARLQPAVLSYEEWAATLGVKRGSIILSWTFMTQSIEDTLQVVKSTTRAMPAGLSNTGSPTPGGAATIYTGTLQVPYYLEAPSSPAAWPVILSTTWTGANSTPLTRYNPTPISTQNLTIPVLATIPNAEKPLAGWPVIIFQHGLRRSRLDLLGLADAMALAGFAVVGIDLPLHGITDPDNTFYNGPAERTFNVDLINDETGAPGPDGQIDPSGQWFANLQSLLTQRDNARQGVADLLHLRTTLPTLDIDSDGNPDFDDTQIHLIGHSLGGTIAGTYLGVEDDLVAATLPSTTGGIAQAFNASGFFGQTLRAGLASVGIQPGTPEFTAFLSAFQQVVDSADPINYIAAATAARPTLAMEVTVTPQDDPSIPPDSIPDGIVPNFVPGAPLSGSEALARIGGLTPVASTVSDPAGLRVFVRYSSGLHSSLLRPTTREGSEMQREIASFVGSEGRQLIVTDRGVLRPANVPYP